MYGCLVLSNLPNFHTPCFIALKWNSVYAFPAPAEFYFYVVSLRRGARVCVEFKEGVLFVHELTQVTAWSSGAKVREVTQQTQHSRPRWQTKGRQPSREFLKLRETALKFQSMEWGESRSYLTLSGQKDPVNILFHTPPWSHIWVYAASKETKKTAVHLTCEHTFFHYVISHQGLWRPSRPWEGCSLSLVGTMEAEPRN